MNRVISEKIRFRNATGWSLTIRMAEMFLPYLTLSITKTPVILGTSTSAVPYGEVGFASHLDGMYRNGSGRSKPLPYDKR